MIQLLNLCTFLSLTAKLSTADISVSHGVMTLSGQTELTCCDRDQNISQCFFYAESRNIGHQNSSDRCCKLTISREELLKGKAGEELRTTIIVRCMSKPDNKTSQDVTITVWRLSLAVFRVVLLVILGTLTLLSLLTFIVFICIIYKSKNQENKQNQSVNSGTVEVLEEKTEIVEDELLYATVNHSAAGENSALAVKYESGTDYATVVIH